MQTFRIDRVTTRWSKLKHLYSEFSIYWTIERKRSKIVEHTIQDMGKRITWKKIVLKTPIDGAVQQKICWKDTNNHRKKHIQYDFFLYQFLLLIKKKKNIKKRTN